MKNRLLIFLLSLLFVVDVKGEDTTSSKNLLGGGNSDDVKIITLDGGYDMSSKNISYYESEALKDSDARSKSQTRIL